jgi:hypothetical protein
MANTKHSLLVGEDGESERAYPKTVLAVPRRVWSKPGEPGILRWSSEAGWDLREPGSETLAEFLELGSAQPASIVRYASKWGVLMHCKHLLPMSHNLLSPGRRGIHCDPLRDAESPPHRGGWEFIGLWQKYAREAVAILEAARSIQDCSYSLPRTQADLALYGIDPDDRPDGDDEIPPTHSGVSWEHVIAGVNRWLTWGDVRPSLSGEGPGGKPQIVYGGAGSGGSMHQECRLFGALAIQLMIATSGDSIMRQCPGCSRWFRHPRPNRKWCPKCGEKGRNRSSSNRSYEKLKQRRR